MSLTIHPGVKWQFRFKGYLLGVLGAFFFLWVILSLIGVLLSFAGISKTTIGLTSLLLIVGYTLFVIIASEIYARMSYTRWFYEFTDDSLKIERGIIWKRYSNVPYERVQNVDIKRGVIARMLGFSSISIQTAGYSAQPYAEGHIPAVDTAQAEQIRTFVMKKITGRRK